MKLYRFEKNEKRKLDTIEKKSLWLCPPKKFNDLNDSLLESIYLTADETTYHALKEGYETINSLTKSYPFPKEIQDKILTLLSLYPRSSYSRLRDIDSVEAQRKTIVQVIGDYIRETSGICCFFQGKPNHPLMWAHYADSHSGFCVEYDVDIKNSHDLFEVNYTTKPESPSIEEILLCPRHTIRRLLTRKSHEWSHEKEYRLIYINELNPQKFKDHDKGAQKLRPESFRINKIITGSRFTNDQYGKHIKDLGFPTISYENFINDDSTNL